MTESADDTKWGKGQKTAFESRMEGLSNSGDPNQVVEEMAIEGVDVAEQERRFRNRKLKNAIRRRLKGTNWDELAEDVLLETMRLAFFDPRELYHADGRMKNMTELDGDTAAAVAGFEVREEKEFDRDQQRRVVVGEIKKVKHADKLRALESLGKWLKLYTERIEVEGLDGLAMKLAEARKRATGEKEEK